MDLTPKAPPATPQKKKTLLLVDDSPRIRPLILEILSDCPCRVLVAETAEEAMRIVDGEAAPIDVLLTDVTMPGMSGMDLAVLLTRRYPHLRVLFISGYSMTPPALKGCRFLEKPFSPAVLLDTLHAMFDN